MRVIDLTAMVMGPYCTQIMADMGADVIKVEPPEGDNTRYISVGPAPGMSGVFVNVNRGKRSVVLDLRTDAGKTALRALIETRGRLHPLDARSRRSPSSGFGYEDVAAINPAIVYTNCYGYSRRGPDAGSGRLRRHHPGGMRLAGRPADADRRGRTTSARSWPTRSPA